MTVARDGRPTTVRPYGSWASPLSAVAAANAGTRFAGLAASSVDGSSTLWWAETRPAEEGRMALVRSDRGLPVDVGPPMLKARSRVNEYGGGVFWLGTDHVYWVDESSQRIVRSPIAASATDVQFLTSTPPAGTAWRYASGAVTPDERWVICERERHLPEQGGSASQDRAVVNEIAAVPTDPTDDQHLLVGPGLPGGGDFVAAPTLSPDGTTLAWLRWDHPDMPWDAAELWAAELAIVDGVPSVTAQRRVAGGAAGGSVRGIDRPVSVALPSWSPGGRLWWCDDSTDWWHLYSAPGSGLPVEGAGDTAEPIVTDASEEVGEPRWVAGGARYGFVDDGRVVFAASSNGLDSVWVLDPTTGERTELPGATFTSVEYVVVHGATVGVVGGMPDRPTSVWQVDLDEGTAVDLRSPAVPLESAWISTPTPITFPTGTPGASDSGEVAHALFYPPASGDHAGPDGELPPLVVRIHGGPTAAARPEFSTSVQFWTTRGFAVADVNYRGSTGYGRAYRDLLRSAWGDVDVDDCIAVTRYLSASGSVDPARCVIRGGSAGGFTALAAVCFQAERGAPGAFAAACSLYGVTDLAALATDTHKFESRYLDGLVGEYPADAAVYRSRSPLFHAGQLDRPVLLLQGTEDKVVPPSQAEVLVEALRRNAVPHAYVLFAGEGHGFHRAETVVRALETELAFYGSVLGFAPAGQTEPFQLS